MSITISIFDLLIIIGMATGIICSVLLIRKSAKKAANRYLALGILGFVWLNTKTLLHSLGLWEIHGIGFFPNGVELVIPPLFYFYVKSFVEPSFSLRRKDWLHFLPFIFSQTYATIVYTAIMQTRILEEKQLIADSYHFQSIKNIEEYLTLCSGALYAYLSYAAIKQYRSWLSENHSDTAVSELTFITTAMKGFLLMMVYVLVNLLLNDSLDAAYSWRWEVSHLMIASLVYYMGLVGYKHCDMIPPNRLIAVVPKQVDDTRPDIIHKLQHSIEYDQVYLNPKLSLQELAVLLDVNESILSTTINTFYKKNFRAFINGQRVEEVKRRLLTEGLDRLSLGGLAKECGFNSEASFYRVFKEIEGLTPKQYLKKHS